jgi:hypothetical protein
MPLPTYTYDDLTWSRKVAKFAKKELFGIGKAVNFWALAWEPMVRDAEENVNSCISNVITCNS